MPVWGNRMVCETANYKHIEEKKKEFLDRESSLGKWATEKAERKRRLSQLNDVIRKASICSTSSQPNNPGDDTMTGSVDLDSGDEEEHHDAAELSDAARVTSQMRRNSFPGEATTNSRPPSAYGLRTGSLGSSFDSGDQAHMVGEGRNRDHPCANCCIQ